MRHKSIYLFICSILLITSCNSGGVSEQDYIKWFSDKDNGLIIAKEISGAKYEMKYLPVSYLYLREAKKSKVKLTKSALDKFRGDHKEACFILTISSKGCNDLIDCMSKKNEINKEVILNYYLNNLSDDFKLISDKKDTTTCSLHLLEYIQGITPDLKINLIFDKNTEDISNSIEILFNDAFINSQAIKFEFDIKKIKESPELKINN